MFVPVGVCSDVTLMIMWMSWFDHCYYCWRQHWHWRVAEAANAEQWLLPLPLRPYSTAVHDWDWYYHDHYSNSRVDLAGVDVVAASATIGALDDIPRTSLHHVRQFFAAVEAPAFAFKRRCFCERLEHPILDKS
jgi:hypothetical protein